MLQKIWVHENRTYLICVDSYENGVLKGWFHTPYQEALPFSSLSQFLLKMEDVLDQMQTPQSYTMPRRFSEPEIALSDPIAIHSQGAKATFELKILFRQHTSWQGVLVWREQKAEHSFRSVLELVILMDSALRSAEDKGVA